MLDENQILEILAWELDIPLADLEQEEEISMEALPEWDSLTHTRIILAIEKKTGATINPLQAAQATSLSALGEMLRQ